MLILADCHVHVYPFYDTVLAFSSAVANLQRYLPVTDGSPHVKILLLAERHDCQFFRRLKEGGVVPSGGIRVAASREDNALKIECSGGESIYLIAGRQIATAEKLELLALTLDTAPADGTPLDAALLEIIKLGGLPVLNWAPGKWSFRRGGIVRDLIYDQASKGLLLCDTSMRPSLCAEPSLMRLARAHNLKVLAGTDPFPFAGEEKRIGRYAISCEAVFEESRPVSSVRDLLRNPMVDLTAVGNRLGVGGVLYRIARLKYHSK